MSVVHSEIMNIFLSYLILGNSLVCSHDNTDKAVIL